MAMVSLPVWSFEHCRHADTEHTCGCINQSRSVRPSRGAVVGSIISCMYFRWSSILKPWCSQLMPRLLAYLELQLTETDCTNPRSAQPNPLRSSRKEALSETVGICCLLGLTKPNVFITINHLVNPSIDPWLLGSFLKSGNVHANNQGHVAPAMESP